MTAKTRDEIRAEILAEVPAAYDTTEGTVPWDIAAANAIAIEAFYDAADAALENFFLTTADRSNLIRRAADYGLTPNPATKAKAEQVIFSMSPGAVLLAGARVATETQSYQTTAGYAVSAVPVTGAALVDEDTVTTAASQLYDGTVIQVTDNGDTDLPEATDLYVVEADGDTFKLSLTEDGEAIDIGGVSSNIEYTIESAEVIMEVEAEALGTAGNCLAEKIIYFPATIAGVSAVINLDEADNGFDEESTEDFRERVIEKASRAGFAGNVNNYIEWAKEVDGVGDVRVNPETDENGDPAAGHVLLRLVDANNEPADAELIEDVDLYINGESVDDTARLAPVGALVHVIAADAKNITVAISGLDHGSYDWETRVKPAIETAITAYLRTVRFNESGTGIPAVRVVSYPLIVSAVLGVAEVTSFTALTINGLSKSLTLEQYEVPVLDEVTKG